MLPHRAARRIGLLAVSLAVAIAGPPAAAQDAPRRTVKDLIGQPVVTTSVSPLRDGTRVIEKDGMFRVYRVEKVAPGKVFIRGGGVGAWVAPSQVVPLEAAVEHFTAEIRRRPSAGLYNKRGLVHNERKEFEEAVADFDEVIKRDAKNAFARNNRGFARQNLGRFEEAIADYDEATRLDPKLAMAYANRGLCRHRTGDHARAIADYDRALALDRNNALAYNNRGLARMETQQYEGSLADLTEALRLDPDLALAHFNLALLRQNCPEPEIRDPKQAVESARRACELTGWKEPNYITTLAAACADAGDPAAAVRWLEKALAAAPDDEKPALQARLSFFRSLQGNAGAAGSNP